MSAKFVSVWIYVIPSSVRAPKDLPPYWSVIMPLDQQHVDYRPSIIIRHGFTYMSRAIVSLDPVGIVVSRWSHFQACSNHAPDNKGAINVGIES